MPTYSVTDSISGKTLELTGDSPPTEQELEEIFAQVLATTPPDSKIQSPLPVHTTTEPSSTITNGPSITPSSIKKDAPAPTDWGTVARTGIGRGLEMAKGPTEALVNLPLYAAKGVAHAVGAKETAATIGQAIKTPMSSVEGQFEAEKELAQMGMPARIAASLIAFIPQLPAFVGGAAAGKATLQTLLKAVPPQYKTAAVNFLTKAANKLPDKVAKAAKAGIVGATEMGVGFGELGALTGVRPEGEGAIKEGLEGIKSGVVLGALPGATKALTTTAKPIVKETAQAGAAITGGAALGAMSGGDPIQSGLELGLMHVGGKLAERVIKPKLTDEKGAPKTGRQPSPEDGARAGRPTEGAVELSPEKAAKLAEVPEYRRRIIKQVANEKNIDVDEIDFATALPDHNYTRSACNRALDEPEKKAIFFFDLDKTKPQNETYGHGAVDEVFEALGGYIRKHFSGLDYGRQGGEEFVVILEPKDVPKVEAFMQDVSSHLSIYGDPVTISGGVASGRIDVNMAASTLAEAAKVAGRNQIIVDIPGKKQYTIHGVDRGEKSYSDIYDFRAAAEALESISKKKGLNPKRKAQYEQQAAYFREKYGQGVKLLNSRMRMQEVLTPEDRALIGREIPGATYLGTAGMEGKASTAPEVTAPAIAPATPTEKISKPLEVTLGVSDVPPETAWEWFSRKVQNKINRLFKIQTIKQGETPLAEEADAYLKARLMPGRVEAQIENAMRDFNIPMQKLMLQDKTDVNDVQLYLMAKHAPEVNEKIAKINDEFANIGDQVGKNKDEGIRSVDDKIEIDEKIYAARKGLPGSGMFSTEADKKLAIELNPDNKQIVDIPVAETILKEFEASGKIVALERASQYILDMNRKTRDILYDAGLISKDVKDNWEKQYQYYVPLRGKANDVEPPMGKSGKGFQVRGPESKRALGRKSLAQNIIGTSVMQHAEAIVRAEKNRVNLAFLKFIEDNPDLNLYEIIESPPLTRVYDAKSGKVVEREDYDWLRKPENQNVLALKKDGNPIYIRIKDEPLARVMTGMGIEQTGAIVRGLAAVNRYLSIINTSLAPEFVLSNFIRDLQTAMINLAGEKGLNKDNYKNIGRAVFKGVLPAIKGVWQGERGGNSETAQYYREFKNAGGRIGFFSVKNAETAQKDFIKAMEGYNPDIKHTTMRYARAVGDFIMSINEAVENGIRLSTYIEMRKHGMTTNKAALVARTITVDFNVKGEKGTLINALWLFANASIQGTARLLTALKSPKVQRIAGSIVALSYANAEINRYLAGEDQDDKQNRYDKISLNEKQRNMIFMGVGPDGQHVMIPIPYGYNIFWALGQSISMATHENDKIAESAVLVGDAIADSFNPIGGAASTWLQRLTPTAARLFVDLGLNKNYLGQPIVPEEKYGPAKAKAFRHFKGTTESSKTIAETASKLSGGEVYQPGYVDIAPDQLDYAFEYATGGAGRTVSRALNLAAKMFTKNSITVQEIPFVRRVYGELHESVDISNFYDALENAQRIKAQLKWLKENNPNKAANYARENRAILEIVTSRKGETQLSTKMTQNIRKLRENAKNFRAQGNNEKAEEAEKNINIFAKRYVAIFNKAQKTPKETKSQ